MQKIYSNIFNLIYKITGRFSAGVRDSVIFLCCLIFMWIYVFSNLKLGSGEVQITGSLLTAVIIVFSIDREMKAVRWNRYTYYSMVIFGLGLILVGQIHSIGDGYMMYALDLILLFPGLYFVWANRGDFEHMYAILSAAILIFGIISFVYCLWLAVRGELQMMGDRVRGFKSNSNYIGMIGVLMLIAALYLSSELKTRKKGMAEIAVLAVSTGIGLVYPVITVSRTAMVAEALCLAAFAIYCFKPEVRRTRASEFDKINSSDKKNTFVKTAVFAVLVAGAVFALGINLDNINYRAISRQESLSTEETSDIVSQETDQSNTSEAEKITDRFTGASDINTLSSGRSEIWRAYTEEFSLWGKPYSVIKSKLRDAPERRAHNNIIDYLYRSGYIVGFIYILYYIAQGITGLRLLFGRVYRRPGLIFTIMIVGTYSVYAMLEICTLAFIRIIPCVYFLTIAPIITCITDQQDQKKNN